ncbi:hypothetical protein FRB90_007133, partial [Tulasnella sp. 427]
MVATRRKSTISYKEPSDDEIDADVSQVDEEKKTLRRSAKRVVAVRDGDDSDVEFDSEEDAKPRRKKTKTTAGAVKGRKSKGKVTARSMMKDLFSTLPIDLIYERSTSVWKTAREAVNPPVPECPKDQSEPQWAALLFTHNCTMCGTPRIQRVDWNLRLRGCEKCFKAQIVYRGTAKKRYRNIENFDNILDLLPWTNSAAHRRTSSVKLYYSVAIIKMVKIVGNYQVRVNAGVKGARADFDSFVEEKKREAKEQSESGVTLRKWAAEIVQLKSDADAEAKVRRKEADVERDGLPRMIAKLIELGHDPRDVQKAADRSFTESVFRVTTQLSETVWNRVKGIAEELVNEERQGRLEIEMGATRDTRRNAAKVRYDEFKKTYDSSPDYFMPSDRAFKEFPPVMAAIQREDAEVSPTIFDEAFEGLPELLDEWRRKRR